MRLARLGFFVLALTTNVSSLEAFWFAAVPGPDPFKKADADYRKGFYAQVIQDLPSASLSLVPPLHLERAYEELAESCAHTGQETQALAVYQLGVKLFPHDVLLLAGFGGLLHQSGLDEQAKPLFDAALQLEPANAQANLGVGQIDGALGFLRRSKAAYLQALQTLNKDPEVWSQYAEVLWRLKDFRAAEEAAKQSLSLSPSAQTQILLAFIQRSEGNLTQALDTLDQLSAQNPGRLDVALARALWLTEAGQWDRALALNEKILAQSPDNSLALWIKASIFLHKNQQRDAQVFLKRAAKAQEETPFVASVAAKTLELLDHAKAP